MATAPSEEDRRRFGAIFDAGHEPLLRYAARRVGPDDARDIVAETMTVAWRRLEDVPDDPLPWLYGTARKVIANHLRGAERRQALRARIRTELDVAAQEEDPDTELLEALARLRPDDREAVLLVGWEGLDRRAAAAVMGCSVPAFAARLRRARSRLAAELRRPGAVAGPVAATDAQERGRVATEDST